MQALRWRVVLGTREVWKGFQAQQHQQGTVPAAAGTVRSRETAAGPAGPAAPAADAQHEFRLQAQPWPQLASAAPAVPPPALSMAGKLKAMRAQSQAELAFREAPQVQSSRHHPQQQAQRTPTPREHGEEQPATSTFGRSWPASPWPPHMATGTSMHQRVSPWTRSATASTPLPGMPDHVPSPLQSGVSSASTVTPQPSRIETQQASNQRPGMPYHVSSSLQSGVSSSASTVTPQLNGTQMQQDSNQQPGMPSHVPSFSGSTFQPVHPPPGPGQAPASGPPLPPMSMPPMGMSGAPLPMASMPLFPPYGQLQGMLPFTSGHPGLHQPHLAFGAHSPAPYLHGPAHPPLAQQATKPFGGTPPPPDVLQRKALSDLAQLHLQIVWSKHVSSGFMIRKLCEMWRCTQEEALEMMCLDDWYSLPYFKELRDWEVSVDKDIIAYMGTYEFAATLSDMALRIDTWEDAIEGEMESWLGPLLCHPRVQEIFRPHPMLHKIPKVTKEDCWTAVQHILNRNQGKRVQIRANNVIEELKKMQQVQNASKLCVKIREDDIGKVITQLNKSADIESASFEVLSEEYQKGNTPQAFKDSHQFGVRDRGHRLLPLSQDLPDADATVDAIGDNRAPRVRVQCTGQQIVSEQPIGRGPPASAGGNISHATSLLQQQAAGLAPRQPKAASNAPHLQQQASGTSASASGVAPILEAAMEDAERTLSETLTEQAGESVGEVEHGDADQPADATSVLELAGYVKGELRKARTKTSADGLMALVQIEQQILSNPQVAKGGFGKLTKGACSSMLDLLSMDPDLKKELQPSLQLPAANMEVKGLPAASARHARTPSVLLLCAVKQAAGAWDRAADHTQQQTPQQRAKAKEEAVAASLCAQFGVRSVEELGFGSAEQLLADESGDMHSDVVAACALACGARGAAAYQQPLAVLGVEERHLKDTAVAMLQAAPNFVDLAEWCQWDLAFGCRFGPLASSDILHEAAKHSAMSDATSWCALVLPGGYVLKLPHADEQMQLLENFGHSVEQLDAAAAVQGMLSLVALNRTCSSTVVQPLKNHVLSALRRALAQVEGMPSITMTTRIWLQSLCKWSCQCSSWP
ncbi:hypothetical protein DUNSADRAFT_9864 [Dunaliella salina]|uniref:Uncharacterized protein n=1 Tax=Dunaliella salina TaxID=3046 RepID=A0ABQ7H563_DUNSA|nr:hypothetical protein DUNSADRAFT_9864 [Dunaliella salina]|eukprot:KAF5841983.1 hypothetical protein DUNSADRAFT_9864 [Dunaliella salina]